MVVNEIFNSIDGEGLRPGELATFIRLAGCNLRCSYCDTLYALNPENGSVMTVEQIMQEIEKYRCKNITLTGGEPLIHKDCDSLINELVNNNYNVNIETNGAVDISDYINKCLITMDYKLPSSNMEGFMILDNLEKLTENDALKFVTEESDLKRIKEVLQMYNIKSYVYISPSFGKIKPSRIVDFMKEMNNEGVNMSRVRTQVQLHKVIWDPNKRGV